MKTEMWEPGASSTRLGGTPNGNQSRKFRTACSASYCHRGPPVSPRVVRSQEVIAWHREDVEVMKRKLNTRAYLFLAIYTIVVVG